MCYAKSLIFIPALQLYSSVSWKTSLTRTINSATVKSKPRFCHYARSPTTTLDRCSGKEPAYADQKRESGGNRAYSATTSPYVYDLLGIGEYRDTVIRDTVTVRGGGNIFRPYMLRCKSNAMSSRGLLTRRIIIAVPLSLRAVKTEFCVLFCFIEFMKCCHCFRFLVGFHLNPWCGS